MADLVERLCQNIAHKVGDRHIGIQAFEVLEIMDIEAGEAADEILRLREENARIRSDALEEAAKVADRAAAGARLEAEALRALNDYARAKQLDMESAACVNLATAIRALAQQREGK